MRIERSYEGQEGGQLQLRNQEHPLVTRVRALARRYFSLERVPAGLNALFALTAAIHSVRRRDYPNSVAYFLFAALCTRMLDPSIYEG